MDTKDILIDLLNEFGLDDLLRTDAIEDLSEEICKTLGICEYCGAKLKGGKK